MKLLELTLTNWGVFRGSNHFLLEPTYAPDGSSRHLTVISGHNGAGKSTLFQALALALHGSYVLGDRVRQRDYDEFLLSRLHRHNGDNTPIVSDQGSVSLSFRYVQSGRPFEVQVTRRWHRNTHSIREVLEVLQDGQPPDVEEEDYQTWINDLVPHGLIPLSFFDAEQLDTLADPEQHDALLEETLKRLLGLDLVAQLRADLDYYILHRGGSREIEEMQEAVLQKQAELEALDTQLEEAQRKVENLVAAQADLEADLLQQERLLASHGGTYAARRPVLQERLQSVEEEIEAVSVELRALSSGLLPFALAPNLCRVLSKRLADELSVRQRHMIEDLWQERIEEFQLALRGEEFWKELDVSPSLREIIAHRLSQTLRQKGRREYEIPSLIHHLSQPKQEQLQEWISQALHAVPDKTSILSKRLKDLRTEYDKIQTDLHRAPADESLAPIHDEILRLEDALEEVRKSQRSLDEQIGALQYQREEKVRQLQRAAENLRETQAGKRKLDLAERSKLALQAYQDALTRQRLSTLENMLVKTFNTICRKEHLLAAASINSDSFHTQLRSADGHSLSLSDFSAGERQLYALSLLWALRYVSGRQLPLVVDTPMARLDDAHRFRLMNEYIPAVSDQVILLATGAELDATLLDQARPYLARLYRLDYDAQEEATRVSQVDESLFPADQRTVSVGANPEGSD